MTKTGSRYEMDMTKGPLLKNMVQFAVPLMFSGFLQLFYNAADIMVVGRFAGSQALAAVGATGAISSLLVNLLMGLSVGTSVIIAQYYGAGNQREVSESVHTSVLLSLLGGLFMGVLGVFIAKPVLTLMGTPEDILDLATLYMIICFAGMPASAVYNFSAAILRAIGDTKRPLYYLIISGAINVVLNLLFVIVFHMSVAGVALATIISQIVSTILVLRCLVRTQGSVHLDVKKLKIHKDKAMRIIRIGFPAGLQSSMFSISNILIQSSVNTFGSTIVAGNAAASNVEGFVGTPLSAFTQAVMSFTSQNYGARKYDRLGKIARSGVVLVTVVGLAVGILFALGANSLIGLYVQDPAVMEWGVTRLRIMSVTCFIGHLAEVFVSGQRGMGSSMAPMLASIMCICVFRMFWIYTIFAVHHTMLVLYLSYPITWTLSMVVHFILFMLCKRRVMMGHNF